MYPVFLARVLAVSIIILSSEIYTQPMNWRGVHGNVTKMVSSDPD